MAKANEKNTNAAALAAETFQQSQVADGEQLVTSVGPVPSVGNSNSLPEVTGNELLIENAIARLDAIPESERAAAVKPVERWTVQAVAVPNNRRMRGGRVFNESPVIVYRDEFSDEQWRDIICDKHLKAIKVD